MNIREFLLARIAEDEDQAANVSVFVGPGPDWQPISLGIRPRVLAECKAKRAIVELHDYEWMGPDDAAGKGCEHDYEEWPCPALRALAAVYSDHPDYQKEWAVQA